MSGGGLHEPMPSRQSRGRLRLMLQTMPASRPVLRQWSWTAANEMAVQNRRYLGHLPDRLSLVNSRCGACYSRCKSRTGCLPWWRNRGEGCSLADSELTFSMHNRGFREGRIGFAVAMRLEFVHRLE